MIKTYCGKVRLHPGDDSAEICSHALIWEIGNLGLDILLAHLGRNRAGSHKFTQAVPAILWLLDENKVGREGEARTERNWARCGQTFLHTNCEYSAIIIKVTVDVLNYGNLVNI